MSKSIRGMTALVTGASQGIGKASALALAQEGADVVIMGRREDALAKACAELRDAAPGARVEMIAGDARNEENVMAALDFAHSLSGRLDVLVSVVGDPTFEPLLMREAQSVQQEFDLNFMTAFLMVRHGAPRLSRGGSIVCVSSAAVTQACWGLSIYAAAKAAVERFVRAAAFELGGAGIRVNAVRPGATLPQERLGSPESSGMSGAFVAETPLGRIGDPDDIARVVRFLASKEAGWVTGQTFSVDGGMDQGKAPDFMDPMFGKERMDQIRLGKA